MTQAKIAPQLEALAYPVEKLSNLEGNPRRGDVEAVMRSYRRFGQRKPITARRRPDGIEEVTAGNHQLEAARRLEWDTIAVVWTEDDDLTAKAWALADNRTAELGGYDQDDLTAMLKDVAVDPELFAATAFTDKDLAAMLKKQGGEDGAPDQSDQLEGSYAVVIPCRDEAQQLALIQRFMDEGLECRAVVS